MIRRASKSSGLTPPEEKNLHPYLSRDRLDRHLARRCHRHQLRSHARRPSPPKLPKMTQKYLLIGDTDYLSRCNHSLGLNLPLKNFFSYEAAGKFFGRKSGSWNRCRKIFPPGFALCRTRRHRVAARRWRTLPARRDGCTRHRARQQGIRHPRRAYFHRPDGISLAARRNAAHRDDAPRPR